MLISLPCNDTNALAERDPEELFRLKWNDFTVTFWRAFWCHYLTPYKTPAIAFHSCCKNCTDVACLEFENFFLNFFPHTRTIFSHSIDPLPDKSNPHLQSSPGYYIRPREKEQVITLADANNVGFQKSDVRYSYKRAWTFFANNIDKITKRYRFSFFFLFFFLFHCNSNHSLYRMKLLANNQLNSSSN